MGWGSFIFPLLIITPTGGFTGLFVYSPTVGTGNLIASITAANGTDPYGNAFRAGITSYQTGSTFISQMLSSIISLGSTTWTGLATIDANTAGILHFASPRVTGLDTQINFSLESSSAGGPAAFLSGGPLALPNLTAPATSPGEAQLFCIGGNLVFVDGNTGDGATYDTGRLTLYATGQTVNSATFANITGVGAINLGIGTYHIRGVIIGITNVNGGVAQIRFTAGGGLVTSSFSAWILEVVVTAGGGAITWGNGNDVNTGVAFSSSALGAANRRYQIDAKAVVTTAGTLTPQVAVTIAADTWNVGTDSYFEVFPVN